MNFKLFRSSSSEVVFHGRRLPDFENFENCFGLKCYIACLADFQLGGGGAGWGGWLDQVKIRPTQPS